MKICLYADPHWSTYSSILRQRGNKYSIRLENLINSINFVEALADMNKCDKILCLGDFFDKNNLSAEEISALKEIKWSNIQHEFLVGNHEIVSTTDSYNSTRFFTSMGFTVIDKPQIEYIGNDTELVYIPYMVEENRIKLSYMFDNKEKTGIEKRIVFSHNDLKMRYGMFESKEGYELADIEKYCTLFINGHLHNGGYVNKDKTILNLGNLTGQNFSEDGFVYEHFAAILDTDTMKIEFFINPEAIYFYKLEIASENDLKKFTTLKNKSVVSIKVNERLIDKVKDILRNSFNIIAHREIITSNIRDVVDKSIAESMEEEKIIKNNHIEKFKLGAVEYLGNSELLQSELLEICK